MNSIYDWSLVASENARADDIINWAEGQPPSTVNDSARAMMQRVREYLSDSGGAIENDFIISSSGRETFIHLMTKSLFKDYKNDIVVRFKSQKTNVGKTYAQLNHLSEKLVYKVTQNGIEPLSGGELQAGGIYELIYHCGIAGKGSDGWYLTNPTLLFSQNLPAGIISVFAMTKIPEGWLLCDGKAYSRTEYASLFAAIGEKWGVGDKRSTFNVPDFRGMFLRGFDDGRGIDKNRKFGSRQEDSFKEHTHNGETDLAGKHWHEVDMIVYQGTTSQGGNRDRYGKINDTTLTTHAGEHKHKLLLSKTGGDETRPVNIAVVYAIKT
ncbi:phage tail protein [Bartonella sp. B41]